MDLGEQVWGPCPLCQNWMIAVDWSEWPNEPEFTWGHLTTQIWTAPYEVAEIVEDAIYEHMEDEHPEWRDLLELSDEQYDLIVERRRRVETVDLLSRLSLPEGT